MEVNWLGKGTRALSEEIGESLYVNLDSGYKDVYIGLQPTTTTKDVYIGKYSSSCTLKMYVNFAVCKLHSNWKPRILTVSMFSCCRPDRMHANLCSYTSALALSFLTNRQQWELNSISHSQDQETHLNHCLSPCWVLGGLTINQTGFLLPRSSQSSVRNTEFKKIRNQGRDRWPRAGWNQALGLLDDLPSIHWKLLAEREAEGRWVPCFLRGGCFKGKVGKVSKQRKMQKKLPSSLQILPQKGSGVVCAGRVCLSASTDQFGSKNILVS